MESQLNPSTGDYSGEISDTLENAVYVRLMTPLGGYWVDPLMGSRLHELAREKDKSRVTQLAEQYASDALAPLLVSKEALHISVKAIAPHNGRIYLHVNVQDASGRESLFKHLLQVG